MMKQILAIFDFCESIVNIQSIPPYLELARKANSAYKSPTSFRQRVLRKGARIIDKAFDKSGAINALSHRAKATKSLLHSYLTIPTYPELANLPLQTALTLAKDYALSLRAYSNQKVIDKLLWHKEMGHTIVVVSGGLGIYIRPFMQEFGISAILAVELESTFDKYGAEILSGNRLGLHTMQERKLYALANHLDLAQYDLLNSYAYSDCPSDVPLLSLVGKPCVIQGSQETRWAKILNYPILIP